MHEIGICWWTGLSQAMCEHVLIEWKHAAISTSRWFTGTISSVLLTAAHPTRSTLCMHSTPSTPITAEHPPCSTPLLIASLPISPTSLQPRHTITFCVFLKALFNNVSTFKKSELHGPTCYQSLIRCKSEALKKLHLKSTIKCFKRVKKDK